MRRRIAAATGAALAASTLGPALAAAASGGAPRPPTPAESWSGRVLTAVSARTAPSMKARVKTTLQPTAPFAGGGTVVHITRTVVRDGRRWVEVLLPIRPNGSRGWIPADVLRLRTTALRIVIDQSERRLNLYRRGRRVMRLPVAVGKAATPTPVGRRFAVAEMIRTRTRGAFLGPIVFPLTGYSEKLNEFAGGNGRVAIHGTSLPALIGTRASAGCIRMYNRDVVKLSRIVRPGTPVEIRR